MSGIYRSWDEHGRLIYRIRPDIVERLRAGDGEQTRDYYGMEYVVLQPLGGGDPAIIPKTIVNSLDAGVVENATGFFRIQISTGPTDPIRNDNCGCETILKEFLG